MTAVLERIPLSKSLYGTDERPATPTDSSMWHHEPVGQDLQQSDIEIWDPAGTLGVRLDFVENLQKMPVLNSFSFDDVRLRIGFVRSSPSRQQDPIIFPGTVFRSRPGFLFVRSLYHGLCPGIVLVSNLTGNELVAVLRSREF